MIDHAIAALADYGVRTGLIEPADRVWAVNRLLEVMGLNDYQDPGCDPGRCDQPGSV